MVYGLTSGSTSYQGSLPVTVRLRRFVRQLHESGKSLRLEGPVAPVLIANQIGPLSKPYSTVTLFARLRGWSTSVPLATAA